MTDDDILEKLIPLGRRVFDAPTFDRESTMDQTATWDSLRHIQLLGAIERVFEIEIAHEDALRLVTVAKLVAYIRRLKECREST